jgi:hypothetical protein
MHRADVHRAGESRRDLVVLSRRRVDRRTVAVTTVVVLVLVGAFVSAFLSVIVGVFVLHGWLTLRPPTAAGRPAGTVALARRRRLG